MDLRHNDVITRTSELLRLPDDLHLEIPSRSPNHYVRNHSCKFLSKQNLKREIIICFTSLGSFLLWVSVAVVVVVFYLCVIGSELDFNWFLEMPFVEKRWNARSLAIRS